MASDRHPDKDIRKALAYAKSNGWIVVAKDSGHAWGTASCGDGCSMSIWSTPKNPTNHAKQIRRAVDKCPH